jgi:hypothetical protein
MDDREAGEERSQARQDIVEDHEELQLFFILGHDIERNLNPVLRKVFWPGPNILLRLAAKVLPSVAGLSEIHR